MEGGDEGRRTVIPRRRPIHSRDREPNVAPRAAQQGA